MTIPARTNRVHLPSRDKRCDTTTVLNMAARRRPGRRFADMNACHTLDGDVNLHFPGGPAQNHFRHIADARTGRIRPMTRAELARDVSQWKTVDVLRWRRKVNGKWIRPYTVYERQRQARLRRVVICWEIKSRDYGQGRHAARFAASVRASKWRAYIMTLVTMDNWGEKLAAFKRAGMETALLPHGARKTLAVVNALHTYDWAIDRIWGAWG